PYACCESCGFVQNMPTATHTRACQRCSASVHKRQPASYSRTWALCIAAAIAYVPANALPVMHIYGPTGQSSHTILGGVVEFWRMGSWDLAIIVFVASVAVPITKLLALAVLMLRAQ